MARITVEDCLTQEPNRFALVLLAAKRTKQLLAGAKSLLASVRNKPVVTALREVATGQVRFMTDEDMKKHQERQAKLREAQAAEQAAMPIAERARIEGALKPDDLFLDRSELAARAAAKAEDEDEEPDLKVEGRDDDDDDDEEDDGEDDDGEGGEGDVGGGK